MMIPNSMVYFWILVGVAVAMLILVWMYSRRACRLSASATSRIQSHWNNVLELKDPVRQVMEADKVFDHLMKELGYEGSFADKLKRAGPRFANVEDLWWAHKLRNRLAHEPGMTVTEKDRARSVRAFEKALASLL